MPCRTDDWPEPTVPSRELASVKAANKKKTDKLTQDLCEARSIIAQFVSGALSVENFKDTPQWKRHLSGHIKHRKQDKSRAIDEIAEKLKNAKTTNARNKLIDQLGEIAAIESDEDLITTSLF